MSRAMAVAVTSEGRSRDRGSPGPATGRRRNVRTGAGSGCRPGRELTGWPMPRLRNWSRWPRAGCRRHRSSWDRACGFLAGEVLATASRPEAIADVQQILVGLELDLLDGGRPAVSPAELVRVVCEAPHSYRFSPPAGDRQSGSPPPGPGRLGAAASATVPRATSGVEVAGSLRALAGIVIVLIGVLAVVAGILYLTQPAHALPAFFPGPWRTPRASTPTGASPAWWWAPC